MCTGELGEGGGPGILQRLHQQLLSMRRRQEGRTLERKSVTMNSNVASLPVRSAARKRKGLAVSMVYNIMLDLCILSKIILPPPPLPFPSQMKPCVIRF